MEDCNKTMIVDAKTTNDDALTEQCAGIMVYIGYENACAPLQDAIPSAFRIKCQPSGSGGSGKNILYRVLVSDSLLECWYHLLAKDRPDHGTTARERFVVAKHRVWE